MVLVGATDDRTGNRVSNATHNPVTSTHDALCPLVNGCVCTWYDGPCDNCDCVCYLIEQVRAHERSMIIDNGREGMTP